MPVSGTMQTECITKLAHSLFAEWGYPLEVISASSDEEGIALVLKDAFLRHFWISLHPEALRDEEAFRDELYDTLHA